MNDSQNTSNAGGALVIGVLAGAALGILFAPKKGSKTRKKIVNSAKYAATKIQNKVTDKINYLKDEVVKFEEEVENTFTDFTDCVTEKAKDIASSSKKLY